VATVACALAAIACQLPAKTHAGLSMTMMARATAARAPDQVRGIATWHAKRSDLWSSAGLASAILTVALWTFARLTGRRIKDFVVATLLLSYILLAMVTI
jgi:hypothetical protein